ncbi:hypothetical protein NQ315_016817 [Exocentrus adspersus]|uniref:YEATS domain-containing protein n=1 Tax=Exocentrus adspersus TaxID=1586481 RepID=A0AAV8VXQ1_9CUCU|nr:hypothetical protein NQ315_016817 [Exocentrus adspersus]
MENENEMEPNKDFANADPDYEKYNVALKEIKERESEENELSYDRVYNVIAEEFDRDLESRQKQLEEIQNKIFKAQKLLHLVRYVLISSYYNKRELEHTSANEGPSVSLFDPQNRIHPAVKKLLGNNNNIEVLLARGKRKASSKVNENGEQEECRPTVPKKVKLIEAVNDNLKVNCSDVDAGQDFQKRKRTKRRILVGNISKWMPSLENDSTTHKWMMYVRGPKEAPDLSQIIDKVVFYLHASYKPHDVVEVNIRFTYPGEAGGEFPLRVQIFFKNPLNKPVSIVHNLKLDKTYTGRQTLGNETVVNLYLHEDVALIPEAEPGPDSKDAVVQNVTDTFKPEGYVNSHAAEEQVQIKNEYFDTGDTASSIKIEDVKEELSNFEHDYCNDIEIVEEEVTGCIDTSLLDHSYSLPFNDSTNTSLQSVKMEEVESSSVQEQETNLLALGLDDTYKNENSKVQNGSNDKYIVKTFTTASGQPIKVLPQTFNKVVLSNGNVVQIKVLKSPQSVIQKGDLEALLGKLSRAEKRNHNASKHRVSLPSSKQFKSMGEALPYLLQRLPLWDESANQAEFKSAYPHVAGSKVEFLSGVAPKKLKRILCLHRFPGSENWNTKAFFMYARSHGYSPVASHGILFKRPSAELKLINDCFSHLLPKQRVQNSYNHDVHVDVVDNNTSMETLKSTTTVDISDSSLKHQCMFVKEVAFESGIVLKPEEIVEGVTWNGAERMILEAVRCLAGNLIRRASHHLVCQRNFSTPIELSANEIKTAIGERSEIKAIMDYQKTRLVKDFFS